ncbi:MAG: aminopeptidase P family protein [Alphaproteobacteria bacterium]|nr:aminopeptidase P family protein [Alphaproteobacteria bacterium]
MMGEQSFERRWARLRRFMGAEDIAAVVVSENARTRYLTGYQRYFTATHVPPVHAVVLTLDAGPYLLIPRHIELAAGEYHAALLRHIAFGEAARTDAIGRVLHAAGVTKGKVAIELGFLAHDLTERMKAQFPAFEFVNADPMMRFATATKFPDEIVRLREAARLVDIGVAAAAAACQRGVTELEIAAEASAAMLRNGAEFINHMTVRSGPHAYGNHPIPTARRLEDGDCVQIDIGCVYGGYVSDTNRTKVVGRASKDQLRLMDVGQKMLEAGIAAVAPGAPASTIWHAAVNVAKQAGMLERVILPFVGHGIGLGLHEIPFINEAATTVLEEGMVFAIEPGVYAEGIGCSRPEDMVLVTATGAELLTHFPRDRDLNELAKR